MAAVMDWVLFGSVTNSQWSDTPVGFIIQRITKFGSKSSLFGVGSK